MAKVYSGRSCPYAVRDTQSQEWVGDVRMRLSCETPARMPTIESAQAVCKFAADLTGRDFEVVEVANG